jgi:hypothetical protein
MKYILAFIMIIGAVSICFSQTKLISFTDASKLEVIGEQKTQYVTASKITIKYRYFTADFKSIGKAHQPLNKKALKKLARIEKSLAAQIEKIHTAYEVAQGNSRFYLATFNSVNYENFRSCDSAAPCKIKCGAVVITIDNKGKKENILIIKSIGKIK